MQGTDITKLPQGTGAPAARASGDASVLSAVLACLCMCIQAHKHTLPVWKGLSSELLNLSGKGSFLPSSHQDARGRFHCSAGPFAAWTTCHDCRREWAPMSGGEGEWGSPKKQGSSTRALGELPARCSHSYMLPFNNPCLDLAINVIMCMVYSFPSPAQ